MRMMRWMCEVRRNENDQKRTCGRMSKSGTCDQINKITEERLLKSGTDSSRQGGPRAKKNGRCSNTRDGDEDRKRRRGRQKTMRTELVTDIWKVWG